MITRSTSTSAGTIRTSADDPDERRRSAATSARGYR
jgi:hypothetical protein